ncbi:hypothetical protein [Candidatus Cryosericum terrychapinii]|jgi:hypothetical protein|uniref:Uncharacterized protein n=1 Tax=Candidatus Cryosericum terrychapinii TaxID=2290919 RepID=A0A398CYY5_9BACT|nr:hypothetical protein [Candidatus Cryosericum terrychapinii]RIE05738.1 hypothetical protein SMC7_06175 [Candidatus Cryosericum terrychapinii]
MTGHRAYGWEALKSEYITSGDDMTLLSLAAKAGVSLKLLSRRAEVENWEWVQARYRQCMGCVQETDIPERRSARRV